MLHNKKTLSRNKNQFITKKDLFTAILLINQEIRKLIGKLVHKYFQEIGKKLDDLHLKIDDNFTSLRRSLKFMEKEIVANRLKTKELENRLNTFAAQKEKLKN